MAERIVGQRYTIKYRVAPNGEHVPELVPTGETVVRPRAQGRGQGGWAGGLGGGTHSGQERGREKRKAKPGWQRKKEREHRQEERRKPGPRQEEQRRTERRERPRPRPRPRQQADNRGHGRQQGDERRPQHRTRPSYDGGHQHRTERRQHRTNEERGSQEKQRGASWFDSSSQERGDPWFAGRARTKRQTRAHETGWAFSGRGKGRSRGTAWSQPVAHEESPQAAWAKPVSKRQREQTERKIATWWEQQTREEGKRAARAAGWFDSSGLPSFEPAAWAQPVSRTDGPHGAVWTRPVERPARQEDRGPARPAWAKPVERVQGGAAERPRQLQGWLSGAEGWLHGAEGWFGSSRSDERGRPIPPPSPLIVRLLYQGYAAKQSAGRPPVKEAPLPAQTDWEQARARHLGELAPTDVNRAIGHSAGASWNAPRAPITPGQARAAERSSPRAFRAAPPASWAARDAGVTHEPGEAPSLDEAIAEARKARTRAAQAPGGAQPDTRNTGLGRQGTAPRLTDDVLAAARRSLERMAADAAATKIRPGHEAPRTGQAPSFRPEGQARDLSGLGTDRTVFASSGGAAGSRVGGEQVKVQGTGAPGAAAGGGAGDGGEGPPRGIGFPEGEGDPRARIRTLARRDIFALPDISLDLYGLPKDLAIPVVRAATRIGPYLLDPTDQRRLDVLETISLVLGARTRDDSPMALKISRMSGPEGEAATVHEASYQEVAALVAVHVPGLVEVGTILLPATTGQQTTEWKNFGILVREYIDGPNLLFWNINRPSMTIPDVAGMFAPLAEDVDAIGRAGIVHRDISPLNIIMERWDIPWLIDFGLAATVGANPQDTFVGTLWRSPEHETDAPLTAATNVYQFGLNIFKLVTGEYFFKMAADIPEVSPGTLAAVGRYETYVEQRLVLTELSPEERAVFSQVFALNPEERPTAVEFLQRLLQAHGGTNDEHEAAGSGEGTRKRRRTRTRGRKTIPESASQGTPPPGEGIPGGEETAENPREIILASNAKLEEVIAKIQGTTLTLEAFLNESIFAQLPQSFFANFSAMSGRIAELYMGHVLNSIVTSEDLRSVTTPFTDARTETYLFERQEDQIFAKANENNMVVREYDYVVVIDGLPVVFEFKAGRVKHLGLNSAMNRRNYEEKLQPLKEYYGTDTFGYVVVAFSNLIREHAELQQRFRASGGKVIAFPFSRVDLERNAAAVQRRELLSDDDFLLPHGQVVFLSRTQIAAGNVRTEAAAELLEYGYQTDFSEGVVDLGEMQRLVDLRIVRARKHPTEDLWVLNYAEEKNQERMGITESIPLAELCRGLIINREGRIMARPFGQILDLEASGELPEGRFIAADKVDGSLGITYWIGDTPYVSTRGTFADTRGTINYATRTVQEYAQRVQETPRGFQFDSRYTYLWEIIEPDKPHVVDYAERQVVLLAIRETSTGRDIPLPQQSNVPFPVVTQYPQLQTMDQVREHLRNHPDSEGVVVLMEDGTRYRIKTDEWIQRDRMQRDIAIDVWQTNVWRELLSGKTIDDLMYMTPVKSQTLVRQYAQELVSKFDALGSEEFRWNRIHPTNETDAVLTMSENPWMMTMYENLRAGVPLPEILNSFPPPLFLVAKEYADRLMNRFNFLGGRGTRWNWLSPSKEMKQPLEEVSERALQSIIWKELYIGNSLEEVIGNIPETRREEAQRYGDALIKRQRGMKGSQEARWQWLRPNKVAERERLEDGQEYPVRLAVWSGLRNGLHLQDIVGDFPESWRELVRTYGEQLRRRYQEIVDKDFIAEYPYNRLKPRK